MRKRIEKSRSRNPCEHAVIGRDNRMKRPRVIARGFLRGLRVALVELDLPAARAKPLAHRGPSDPGADDGRFSLLGFKRFIAPLAGSDEHLFLVAEPFALFHRK